MCYSTEARGIRFITLKKKRKNEDLLSLSYDGPDVTLLTHTFSHTHYISYCA